MSGIFLALPFLGLNTYPPQTPLGAASWQATAKQSRLSGHVAQTAAASACRRCRSENDSPGMCKSHVVAGKSIFPLHGAPWKLGRDGSTVHPGTSEIAQVWARSQTRFMAILPA
nr:hypothetical protein [Corynebacterium matruchotii]